MSKLTIKTEYDKLYWTRIQLRIPELHIDEELGPINRFDEIPSGKHRGILTLYTVSGKILHQNLVFNVVRRNENLHVIDLYQLAQNVVFRPVDTKNHIVKGAEVKVESVDSAFRPVRPVDGATYSLQPGTYQVKVALPNMEVKSFSVQVNENQEIYNLPIMVKSADSRREQRLEVSLPVGYRTSSGNWTSTRSINLSSDGACLMKGSLDPGTGRIYVRLLFDDFTVECFAKVRWMREGHNGPSMMGLEFQIDDPTREKLGIWLNQTASMKATAHNFLHR